MLREDEVGRCTRSSRSVWRGAILNDREFVRGGIARRLVVI